MIRLYDDELEEFFKETQPDVYEEMKERERNYNAIHNSLISEEFTFGNKKLKQEGYVHPDPRGEYTYQFSYFLSIGPAGHINGNTIEKLATGILEYGFSPVRKESLEILT